jgi:hypothetical protein
MYGTASCQVIVTRRKREPRGCPGLNRGQRSEHRALDARFRVEFRDRIVELEPGELVVIPRGIEHRTAADEEAEVMLLGPAGFLNTGNIIDEPFTAPMGATI